MGHHPLPSACARWDPGAEERLKRAAVELYLERGYDNVTVTHIAERAGLTRRSYFRYFPDKRHRRKPGPSARGARQSGFRPGTVPGRCSRRSRPSCGVTRERSSRRRRARTSRHTRRRDGRPRTVCAPRCGARAGSGPAERRLRRRPAGGWAQDEKPPRPADLAVAVSRCRVRGS
ncbi:helix-turn-helix domain-containing protein [Sphaerisporangium sp. NPDC051011]|uniref:helix-turn-helix domain-containing protein n=1 Tax=Sphaerisporangium sp. NPDC051011 TaxID=3155792 RepID=UPI0034061FBB